MSNDCWWRMRVWKSCPISEGRISTTTPLNLFWGATPGGGVETTHVIDPLVWRNVAATTALVKTMTEKIKLSLISMHTNQPFNHQYMIWSPTNTPSHHHRHHHSQNVCSADVDLNESTIRMLIWLMCVLSNQEDLLRLRRERGGALEDRRHLEAELKALQANHRSDHW